MKTWFKIIGWVILFMAMGQQLAGLLIVPPINALLNLDLSLINLYLMINFVTFLSIVLLVIWRRRRLKESIHLEKPKISVLLLTIPLAISLNFFNSYLMELLPLEEEAKEFAEWITPLLEAPFWQGFFIFAIFAAFNEELLLRGLVYHELRRKTSVMVAVVIQGVLFGIMHLNIFQFIYTSPMGILIGFLYVWTRSIWVVISLHFANNLFSLILAKYVGFQPTSNVLYMCIALIIAIGFIVWIYRLQKGSKIGHA